MRNISAFGAYGKRYMKTFFRNFWAFFWHQLAVGLVLALGILWSQIHHHIVTAQFRDNLLAVVEPYLGILALLVLWHLGHTAYSIYLEDQREIGRLKVELKAHEPAQVPATITPTTPAPIELHGEILEICFQKSHDMPAFPSCTTILIKARVVNRGYLEAAITGIGLRVGIGSFQAIAEIKTQVPDTWRVKYRDQQYMNTVYIETPISPLLGHSAQDETYRTAVPRTGWLAFDLYWHENIEFPNADFTLGIVDAMGGQHFIHRRPDVYVKSGIFIKTP